MRTIIRIAGLYILVKQLLGGVNMSNYGSKRRIQQLENLSKMRRKECENKTFKLVGVVNIFRVVPGFVFPVFRCEQDGKNYMQEGNDDTLTLNSFFETEPYRDLKNVILLDTININEFTHLLFTIDSKPVFAFQISENDYFIGHADDMKRFLKHYTTEDPILKKEIEDFMNFG